VPRFGWILLEYFGRIATGKRAVEKERLKIAHHVVAAVGLGRHQDQDRARLAHHEMRQRCGEQGGVADAHRLEHGHPLDPRVADRRSDALLVRIQADRAGLGGDAGSLIVRSIHVGSGSTFGGLAVTVTIARA
jgi:hypothetical protein